MVNTSESTAVWNGTLVEGSGTVALATSKVATFEVNWKARSAGAPNTTNPEELLAAAHASCYSMALAHALTGAGTPPEHIQATAAVTFEAGKGVLGSHLTVNAKVPGITADQFAPFADQAKTGCPISQALAGIPITLEAVLV